MKNKLFKKKCQTGTVLPPKGAYENRQYFGLPDTMTRDEFSQLTPQQIQESIKAFNAKQMEGVKGVVGDTISRQPYNFQKETTQYSQIPVAKQTFQEAYAAAKNQGLSQFMFEGRPIAVKDDPNFRSPSQQLQPEYKTIQTSNTTTIPFKPENMRNQTGGDQSQQIMQVVMQALQQGKQPQEILQALVQSGMDEAQATQIIQQVMQQGQQQSQTGDLASRMGFRFDSPYQYNKSLNINTPNGTIDMSQTPYPLYGQGDNGMSKYMAPYSGMHDFGNATQVMETNLAFNGTQKKPANTMGKGFAQMGEEVQEAQMQQPEQDQDDQQEQIVQMIAQALQEGKSPEEIMQALVEAGVPQEQAQQMIQQVMSQMQGQQQQPQDSGALQMQPGGMYQGKGQKLPVQNISGLVMNNVSPEQAIVMSEEPAMKLTETAPQDPFNLPTYKIRGGAPRMILDETSHVDSDAYFKQVNEWNKAATSQEKEVVKAAEKIVTGNNNVKALQQKLVDAGYGDYLGKYGVDGIYGSNTAKAVEAYQRGKQLKDVDGIAGKQTLTAIGLDVPSLQKSMNLGASLYSKALKTTGTSPVLEKATKASTTNSYSPSPFNFNVDENGVSGINKYAQKPSAGYAADLYKINDNQPLSNSYMDRMAQEVVKKYPLVAGNAKYEDNLKRSRQLYDELSYAIESKDYNRLKEIKSSLPVSNLKTLKMTNSDLLSFAKKLKVELGKNPHSMR